jgi:hypothetical protein
MKSFPNELLELVLKDVCEIDDEVFESAYKFYSRPQNAATRIAPLLVCRSWHSSAFSSFYRTVILSTVVHARHFARILSGHPNLGNHVRKIFFNGGFGATTACKILQATPRLTHLHLSLAIKSLDSTQGLCKTLHCVQPRSLRLSDFNNTHDNIHTRSLLRAICSCMKGKWTRLVKFRFPYEIDWYWKAKEANKSHLLEAMVSAPFLKIIHMPGPYNPNALRPLLAKPSLCAIFSETPFGLMQGHHIRGTTDQLPIQQLELCNKIYFPLPGPWAPSCRPYEAMEAGSK